MKFALAVLTGVLLAQATVWAGDRHDGIAKLHHLILEEFTVKEAWDNEVMDKVRMAWFAVHPQQSFPVICLEPEERRENAPTSYSQRNISGYEAVQLAAGVNAMSMTTQLDMIRLKTVFGLGPSSYIGRTVRLTDTLRRRLGILEGEFNNEDDGKSDPVQIRLKELGLQFASGTRTVGYREVGYMVHNTPEEHEKLQGLIRYAEDGFVIQKLP